jgi:uncharacterized protein YndB with AHSA1/START domain
MAEAKIVRIFDAPVEKVWAAWTVPGELVKWWGPKHFTSPSARMDVREGGAYLWCMQSPDGQKMYTTGTFTQVTPGKRLVYTDSFADGDGNRVDPSTFGMPADFPKEMRVEVTFEPLPTPPGGGALTRLTIKHGPAPEGDHSDFMEAGWHQSLDKLAASVEQE